MRAYVAVTDGDWFRFLRELPGIDEVNFWQPGGERGFSALDVGQPFLFKLHYPEHFIVGGGFLRHTSILPSSLAWDAFREKNGAPSFPEMRRRIERYRRVPPDPRAEYKIGCIILADPFFFEDRDWIRPPEDFARTIVQGKTYDLTAPVGRALWESVMTNLKARQPKKLQVAEPEPEMFGKPVLVRPRLGQGTFRVIVTDTYLPWSVEALMRPVTDAVEVNGMLEPPDGELLDRYRRHLNHWTRVERKSDFLIPLSNFSSEVEGEGFDSLKLRRLTSETIPILTDPDPASVSRARRCGTGSIPVASWLLRGVPAFAELLPERVPAPQRGRARTVAGRRGAHREPEGERPPTW